MTKITLNNVGSLIDATTAETAINNNFDTIETAFDNTLSRNGLSPNSMRAPLDMNSNHILNLPAPGGLTEPVRLTDLETLSGGTIVISNTGALNAIAYGADPTGVEDCTDAFNNMVTDLALGSGAIYFPTGKYRFDSNLTVTLGGSQSSLSIFGDGTDVSILYWPNATGGLKVTYTAEENTTNIHDLTFSTGQSTGGGTGLELSQSVYLGAFPESTIKNVYFRGETFGGGYWNNGILVSSVSGVIIDKVTVWGGGDAVTNGTGVYVNAAPLPGGALGVKINNSWFGLLHYGIRVEGFQQNIFATENSLLFCGYGFYNNSAGDAYFANNTLNTTIAGFYSNGSTLPAIVSGNYFEVGVASVGIQITDMRGGRILGNNLGGSGGVGDKGIYLSGVVTDTPIVGNNIENFTTGISLGASSANNDLKANRYYINVTNVSDSGTLNLSDSQFDKTITLKGANTSGIDLTAVTGMIGAINLPNNTQILAKDNGGNLQNLLQTTSLNQVIVGSPAGFPTIYLEAPTVIVDGNIIPGTDNTRQSGTNANRWSAVNALQNKIWGSTSGVVTQQASTGTYNFNLPTTAGTSGQALLSGGGGAAAMTYGTLGVAAGGTGVTSKQGIQASLDQSYLILSAPSVNFNSTNTDTAFNITLPTGFTRYLVSAVYISGASASLTTATFGVFTAAAAGGTAVVASGSAITVSTSSENTNNNTQSATVVNSNSTSYAVASVPTLYFRVQTPQGSAATGNVALRIQVLP